VLLLIADWGFVVEGRVAMGVVPPFDVLEDGQAGVDLGGEAPAVESSHSSDAKKLSHRALS
jgi:hypothetical protein